MRLPTRPFLWSFIFWLALVIQPASAATGQPSVVPRPPSAVTSRTPDIGCFGNMRCLTSPNPQIPAQDFFIYRDGLESGWEDWSWSTTTLDLCSTDAVYAGACAASVDLASWGGLSFRHNDFSTNAWDSLVFYIHGGTAGGQQLQVFLHGAGGGQSGTELPPVSLNDPAYIEGGVVAAGVWKPVTIPLADLSGADTIISRVTIQAIGDQSLFYVDEMSLTGTGSGPQPFRIVVDTDTVQRDIPSTMFGGNAAMWSSNLHQNTDVVEKVGASGLRVIRFPGGSTSDTYHWQEYEPGNPSNSWSTNTTEFIQFAQAAGAEPMITANFGTGTAQEAADWVAFTNVQNNWHVQYWEVGNEIYGSWESSWTHDAAQYMLGDSTHDGFNDFCAAMKAIDPTIQVGAVGTLDAQEYDGWGPMVLQLADDCLDFYVIHRYPYGPGTIDYTGLLLDPQSAWPMIAGDVYQMIADYAPGRDVAVGLTEYNSYWTEPESPAVETVNMLYLADTLGQAIQQGFAYANHWDVINGATPNNNRYGLLLEDQANYRQPSYYVYPLWATAGDQLISSTVSLDPGLELAVYTTRHSSTGDVTLIAINKTGALTGTVTIDSLAGCGVVEATFAQGNSLADPSVAYNGVEDPPLDLSTVSPQITIVSSGTFSYTLPAYSVTSLTIRPGRQVMLPVIHSSIRPLCLLSSLRRLLPGVLHI